MALAGKRHVRSIIMKNFRQQLRKATIIGYSILCALASACSFFFAITDSQDLLQNLISGAVFLGLAFAIFQQYRWALRLAAAICLFAAVLLPIGVFNPFTAGDYMVAGEEPPSVVMILLWMIPLEALLLAIVFIIDPRKKRTDHDK